MLRKRLLEIQNSRKAIRRETGKQAKLLSKKLVENKKLMPNPDINNSMMALMSLMANSIKTIGNTEVERLPISSLFHLEM